MTAIITIIREEEEAATRPFSSVHRDNQRSRAKMNFGAKRQRHRESERHQQE
jgi:hypothetical protein